jgi:hypothetical protein
MSTSDITIICITAIVIVGIIMGVVERVLS